jgi:hypothetical protein
VVPSAILPSSRAVDSSNMMPCEKQKAEDARIAVVLQTFHKNPPFALTKL